MGLAHSPKIVTDGLVLCLDAGNTKSYPGLLGSELVTTAALTAVDGSVVTITTGGVSLCNVVAGNSYVLRYTVSAYRGTTGGTFRINLSAGNYTPSLIGIGAVGTYYKIFTANVSGDFSFYPDNTGVDLDLDFVSVKQMLNTNATTWKDLSSSNLIANLENDPLYVTTNGGSIYFDGTVGKTASVTYDSSNFRNTNFTWIAWVKGVGSPTVNMPQIGYGSGSWPRLGFIESAGTWYFQQFNAAGPPAISSVSCGASSNTVWKQICCVGNYSNTQIIGYNNGSFVANAAYVDSNGNYNILGIGRAGTTYIPWNEAFSGNIATVKIYNRALTAAEVQQNFNALRGRYGV